LSNAIPENGAIPPARGGVMIEGKTYFMTHYHQALTCLMALEKYDQKQLKMDKPIG
jgi:hypothetical protein